jgi:endonuclease III
MATERETAPAAKRMLPAVGRWFGKLDDASVRKIYDILARRIVPRSDLKFSNEFELLIAVVLSAHTTDRSVNAATEQLFAVVKKPEDMVRLGVNGLIPHIKKVGLYYAKARNVVELCRLLVGRHGGKVPDSREALEDLPGVGRKTANVVLNIAFGQPTIAVDTHIHRVANRTGIAVTRNPLDTEQVLLARTPKKHVLNAHHYLILHGRYTCIARKPECWRCPIAKLCRFTPKTPAPEKP